MTINQSNKELAIALAEKLGDGYIWIHDDADGFMYHKSTDDDLDIEQYLESKAKDIIFMDGMAERIIKKVQGDYCRERGLIITDKFLVDAHFVCWFLGISPQKVITVFLELED